MKVLQKIFSLLLLLLFSFSCSREVDFNDEKVEPILVLNAIFEADSTAQVRVFKSKSFTVDLGVGYSTVDDAKVQLWKNGEKEITLKAIGEGKYVTDEKLQIADELKLKATSKEFPEGARASVTINTKPNVLCVDTISLSFITEYRINRYNDTTHLVIKDIIADLKIKIQDPAKNKNFYRVSAFLRAENADKSTKTSPLHIYSNDRVFKQLDIGFNPGDIFGDDESNRDYPEIENNFFSDLLFNGAEYDLMLRVKNTSFYSYQNVAYFPYYNDNSSDTSADKYIAPTKVELLINLESISESMFLFLQTSALFRKQNLFNLFSEPVQIYSNIEGGVGILASTTSSIHSIQLPLAK